ncbi:MAG TPA: DUF4386 domain-containing protein [Cellvibrio sp.]|nr:DUF4386 domain-containing protein [Cellvibrio sp.]
MDDLNKNLKTYVMYLGLAYLTYTFIGLVNTFFLKPGIYNVETFIDTVERFRIAQAMDLIMYCVVIAASWASYLVARVVNKEIALLAFLFRFGEGLLGCVAGMVVLMPLILLKADAAWPAFDTDQLRALAVMFMRLGSAMWNILFVLMGIGALIFLYLFYVSKYFPKWLIFWGLFTYGSMIIFGLTKIVVSNPPEQMKLLMYPGALFELVFGCWLLVKGLSKSPLEKMN